MIGAECPDGSIIKRVDDGGVDISSPEEVRVGVDGLISAKWNY